MPSVALQPDSAWAEDRATQRCDPSAVPGAEVGVGAQPRWAPLPFLLRSWHQSAKPSRQDAATLFLERTQNFCIQLSFTPCDLKKTVGRVILE